MIMTIATQMCKAIFKATLGWHTPQRRTGMELLMRMRIFMYRSNHLERDRDTLQVDMDMDTKTKDTTDEAMVPGNT